VGQTRREFLKSTSQPAVVATLAPHLRTGRNATDVLSSPLSQSSSRIIALSIMATHAVNSRDGQFDIHRNSASFAPRARSGSSFAGDVSPELRVVRNEKGVFDRDATRSTDTMTHEPHAIASFELHVPPRRRM